MTSLATPHNRHGKENSNKSSAVAEMGDRAIAKWAEKWGGGWAEAYLRTKWHLDPSGRLATTDMGRRLRG